MLRGYPTVAKGGWIVGGWTLLSRAVETGILCIMKRLLEAGTGTGVLKHVVVNTMSRGTTPLMRAIFVNDVPSTKLLIEAGADVNLGDGDDVPRIAMVTRIDCNVQILHALLVNGASVGDSSLRDILRTNNREAAIEKVDLLL